MRNNRIETNSHGFTLIEILMAIGLIAILATVGITQFTDFTADSKNAAVKQSLSVLREAIARQTAQMRVRCASNSGAFPPLANLAANDITSGGAPCTTTQIGTTIGSAADRGFVSGGIPENPWSTSTCTTPQRRGVAVAGSALAQGTAAGTAAVNVASSPASLPAGCGWQYHAASGTITANSANNGGGSATEDSY